MNIEGAIFDLDGVISKTEKVHAKAWKDLFDEFLINQSKSGDVEYLEFDQDLDYLRYVDGKPRIDGIKSFLKSRDIYLQMGDSKSDEENLHTYTGLGNKKDKLFNKYIDTYGIDVYESTIELIHKLDFAGKKLFVASSSKNCRKILRVAGLEKIFQGIYDGTDLVKDNVPGKPEPFLFLNVIKDHDLDTRNTVVFEDAVAGVQSAKAGGFYTIGISRSNNKLDLEKAGADRVVNDLEEVEFSATRGLKIK